MGIGFVAYSPLGRGFLTGTVADISKLSDEDFRHGLPRFQGDNFTANQKLVNHLREVSSNKGCSMAQVALAWILQNNAPIVPIPGVKKISHLEDNLGTLEVQLSDSELAFLDKVFYIGSAKGDKYPDEFECEA